MSDITDCQAELAAEQARATGLPSVATIGKQTVAAVIGAMTFSEVIVDGGVAQRGTQVVAITKALLTDFADQPNGEPPKYTPTSVRGTEAQVLDVDERDGVFYITCGDPVGEEG